MVLHMIGTREQAIERNVKGIWMNEQHKQPSGIFFHGLLKASLEFSDVEMQFC